LTKGWDNKLTELLGEHLAAEMLIGKKLVVSPLPKNTPYADLLATNEQLKTVPIVVRHFSHPNP
jgi:hypothetical protein